MQSKYEPTFRVSDYKRGETALWGMDAVYIPDHIAADREAHLTDQTAFRAWPADGGKDFVAVFDGRTDLVRALKDLRPRSAAGRITGGRITADPKPVKLVSPPYFYQRPVKVDGGKPAVALVRKAPEGHVWIKKLDGLKHLVRIEDVDFYRTRNPMTGELTGKPRQAKDGKRPKLGA